MDTLATFGGRQDSQRCWAKVALASEEAWTTRRATRHGCSNTVDHSQAEPASSSWVRRQRSALGAVDLTSVLKQSVGVAQLWPGWIVGIVPRWRWVGCVTVDPLRKREAARAPHPHPHSPRSMYSTALYCTHMVVSCTDCWQSIDAGNGDLLFALVL